MKDFSPFVPFDLYDFFGYLFPGIIFGTCVTFFLGEFYPPIYESYQSFIFQYNQAPFLLGSFVALSGIVILYALGHFIATISHIIIDRVLIDGVEGYPINFLLKIPRETREYSESTFKYLFTTYNLLLVMPVFILDEKQLHTILMILFIIISCLILQRIIVMLVRFKGEGRVLSRKLGDQNVFRIFLWPSRYFIDPIIAFFRKLLGLDRRFPDSFIAMYKKLFHERFNPLEANDVGSENYWLPAFHAVANNRSHEKTLQTWLHLYGFSRNASAAFYLSSSLIVGHLFFNPEMHTSFIRIQLGIQWLLAVILGLRYWILYSHYYSKGVIRAFVESVTSIQENNPEV